MTTALGAGGHELPPASSVLAVCAHPDDESFGVGAVLDRFVERGASVAVLCFTRGEASTLGPPSAGLAELRSSELTRAAAELGVARLQLLDHPDGSLGSEPLDQLAAEVATTAEEVGADLVVVFDEGGVTGHPDHRRATEAALAAGGGLPVLAWAIPRQVADALNEEFGTGFTGRSQDEIDLVLRVDRTRQSRAIACHPSQCDDNPVLERRLALLGDTESLRWLRCPAPGAPPPGATAGPGGGAGDADHAAPSTRRPPRSRPAGARRETDCSGPNPTRRSSRS
jgi:LmbE family N-acetylglucosaminyl deacetylase